MNLGFFRAVGDIALDFFRAVGDIALDFFPAMGNIMKNSTIYESGLRFAIVLALVAAGEWIAEKSGTINISVEGMLLGGAFASAMGQHLFGSIWLAILLGAVAGLMAAWFQANLSHRLTADQFVVGLTLNILILGVASFLNSSIGPKTERAHVFEVPGLVEFPLVGRALFGQRWPFYLVYLVVPVCWWLVYRTRWGLEVRAAGENPQAADVSGIHVNRRRRQSIYVAGITSGLGGAVLLLGQVGRFEDGITSEQGFIALAAVIFGGWTLRGAMFGCLLFGMVTASRLTVPALGYELNSELLQSLPYVVTIVTVAIIATHARPPAALARPFIRDLE